VRVEEPLAARIVPADGGAELLWSFRLQKDVIDHPTRRVRDRDP
jgi:hypothetical protein